jgi:hypothetical protein
VAGILVEDAERMQVGEEVYFVLGEGYVSQLAEGVDGPVVGASLGGFESEGRAEEEEGED